MSKPTDIVSADFKAEVIDSKLPVLVDFWAPWCGPCQMMSPILDQLSEEMQGKAKIVKVNVDMSENEQLAFEYQIQSIPNMKLFKDGKVVANIVGMRPKDALISEISNFI